jgi:hypothetical protein
MIIGFQNPHSGMLEVGTCKVRMNNGTLMIANQNAQHTFTRKLIQ